MLGRAVQHPLERALSCIYGVQPQAFQTGRHPSIRHSVTDEDAVAPLWC